MEGDARVAVAYGLAEQLFDSDLRARNTIEHTGDRAIAAWQRFAARKNNRGLWSVLEQVDRCAFAERWRQLAEVYAEQGELGVFDALRRAKAGAALPPETP